MNRRRFIGMVAAGTGSLIVPAAIRHGSPLPLTTLARPYLLDVLHDDEVVRRIGHRYRDWVPDEDNPYAIARALFAEAGEPDAEAISAKMHSLIKRDFERGRTVVLDGWVLSLTEARQCALYSMLHT